MENLIDKAFVTLQQLLPARAIGGLVNRIALSRRTWLKNPLIWVFIRLFDVDTGEMDQDNALAYGSFNAFFTRALKPGARPIDADPGSLICPADGAIQQYGRLDEGRLVQAKDFYCTVSNLLHAEPDEVAPLRDGDFMTVYLAPHNYHRVHAPLDGQLKEMRFIPGKLFSVNRRTAQTVPGLFAMNERLACRFQRGDLSYWLVFVGAMNVSSITTHWHGDVAAESSVLHQRYEEQDYYYKKGDYLGHFNLGSTVVMVFPTGLINWQRSLEPDDVVTVGRKIATINDTHQTAAG